VAAAGRRRIAGGRPDSLHGLGDARDRAGRHRRPGLADEQDRAAVVQTAPTTLKRIDLSRAITPTPKGAANRPLMPMSGSGQCQDKDDFGVIETT
jgi:hypothetical protein